MQRSLLNEDRNGTNGTMLKRIGNKHNCPTLWNFTFRCAWELNHDQSPYKSLGIFCFLFICPMKEDVIWHFSRILNINQVNDQLPPKVSLHLVPTSLFLQQLTSVLIYLTEIKHLKFPLSYICDSVSSVHF